MKIYNLKKHIKYLQEYVNLRNIYHNELLTETVTDKETISWLTSYNIEVIIAVEDTSVTGACILHIYRNGEITIFIKDKRLGIGTMLLKTAEKHARIMKLPELYAWIDDQNIASKKFFLTNGYTIINTATKIYRGKKINGSIYQKIFS